MALAILGIAAGVGRLRPLTVVCVGTDRSTGDSLGPLVGTLLSRGSFKGKILGDLEEPVHAENLDQAAARLCDRDGLVVGVDACLGTRQEVGKVMVRPGPLRPGLGVKTKLSPIGDLYVAGVVNAGGLMEYMVLQNTRLSLVIKMAEAIAAGILKAEAMLSTLDAGGRPLPDVREDGPIPAGLETGALQSPLLQAFSRQRG